MKSDIYLNMLLFQFMGAPPQSHEQRLKKLFDNCKNNRKKISFIKNDSFSLWQKTDHVTKWRIWFFVFISTHYGTFCHYG